MCRSFPLLDVCHNTSLSQVLSGLRLLRRGRVGHWRWVGDVAQHTVDGTPARGATLRRRAQGDGVINPAYIERRSATFRERLASLTRRGQALARRTLTWQHDLSLMGPFPYDHWAVRAQEPT